MNFKAGVLQAAFLVFSTALSISQDEPFSSRVLCSGLGNPWEILVGPDGYIWVTERTDKQITRIHPISGNQSTLITINEVYQSAGQDGLLGMTLHSEFLHSTGNDYLYVVYTYDDDPGAAVSRKMKLRRYTYNSVANTLGGAVDILTDLPASNDHNSGRLVFGNDYKLYLTLGDMGSNQFSNMCNPVRSQQIPTASEVSALNWNKYQGKILRINLDGSIPADNPIISGVRSHIFSYGHRNAQGLAFAPDGRIYSSEHGPKSDDEINLIQAGKNYGWPHVAGYRDNQAYLYGNWSASAPLSCASLTFSDYIIPSSVPVSNETSWTHPDFQAPIKTLFTVGNSFNFQDPACALPVPNYFICWPTIAPSSLDYYPSYEGSIPGWENSLLAVSLKNGCVYRMKLNASGTALINLSNGTDTSSYFKTTNRYRDIAADLTHNVFYIATDNSGSTSGPSSGWTSSLSNPGSILAYTYTGIILKKDIPEPRKPEIIRNSIRIYPNPSDDLVQVVLTRSIPRPFKVEVLDMQGQTRITMSSDVNSFTLDVGKLNPGVYVVRIMNGVDYEIHVGKLIKR